MHVGTIGILEMAYWQMTLFWETLADSCSSTVGECVSQGWLGSVMVFRRVTSQCTAKMTPLRPMTSFPEAIQPLHMIQVEDISFGNSHARNGLTAPDDGALQVVCTTNLTLR